MELNLTQLRDLSYICQIAREGLAPEYGLPTEQHWLATIERYRAMLALWIKAAETPVTPEPNFFGQLLGVLSDEELLRIQRRFQMRANPLMEAVIGDEIAERRMLAKKHNELHHLE